MSAQPEAGFDAAIAEATRLVRTVGHAVAICRRGKVLVVQDSWAKIPRDCVAVALVGSNGCVVRV
jgi:hypothetical protein